MILRLFLILTVAALALSGSQKPRVMVSIVPLEGFVRAIAQNSVDVSVMVLPGSSPATYEPKPSQMRDLTHARLYFAVGVPFENAWLPRFAAQNSRMKIVPLYEGIARHMMARHEHHHDEEHDHDEHEHNAAMPDPHIWLSPSLVKKMADRILKELAGILPDQAATFARNHAAFIKEIDATDRQIRTILETAGGSSFMIFHPSWGYFAREYGLTQLPIELEGKEPKPRQLGAFINEAREHKVQAIFVQPEFSQKAARQIAGEVGVNVLSISSLAPDWSENLLRFARAFQKASK